MKNQNIINNEAMDLMGLQLARGLSMAAGDLSHDVSERLRVARQQALASRQPQKASQRLVAIQGNTCLALAGPPGEGLNLWNILGSALPLIALLASLIAFQWINNENAVAELAEIDSALLVDELPPAAYTDPGFVQFLKQGVTQESGKD